MQLVDVNSRHETAESLSIRASSDSLTGLASRSYFLERLTERLAASSGNFGQMVEQALHDASLRPDQLAIEFTETHLARIRPELLDDLRALNATGVGLAADDFGTGYSPLTKITELPLDMVKIDKQFVAGMLHDPRSMAVVQALVGLGKALALDVVAEGVESLEEARGAAAARLPLRPGLPVESRRPTRALLLAASDAKLGAGTRLVATASSSLLISGG